MHVDRNEGSLLRNMCNPPEFLVHRCPLVYLGVTLCLVSNGDAYEMWCFDRLARVPRRIDSPRLHVEDHFLQGVTIAATAFLCSIACSPV